MPRTATAGNKTELHRQTDRQPDGQTDKGAAKNVASAAVAAAAVFVICHLMASNFNYKIVPLIHRH